MFKLVFLLKRRPDMSLEAFHHHLRQVHAPLVAARPEVVRYVQSCTLPQGYVKGELLFDGIGEVWFESHEGFEQYKKNPGTASVIEDGAKFLDVGRTVIMPVDVHVIKDGAPLPGSVKSIEFVNRSESLGLDEFRRYWREHHGPLACHIAHFRRYEQNHLSPEGYNAKRSPAFDGLAVTWFDSTEDMKKAARTPAYEVTRLDEGNFLREGHLPFIITHEYLVKG